MYEVEQDFTHNGKKYRSGYSYIVPKNQKKHRLINAMFETRTIFNDSLFYDVSSWTLPLAFNLDYDLNYDNKIFDRDPHDIPDKYFKGPF